MDLRWDDERMQLRTICPRDGPVAFASLTTETSNGGGGGGETVGMPADCHARC